MVTQAETVKALRSRKRNLENSIDTIVRNNRNMGELRFLSGQYGQVCDTLINEEEKLHTEMGMVKGV